MGLGFKEGEFDYSTLKYEQLDELIDFHEVKAFGEKLTVNSDNFEPKDADSFEKWVNLTRIRKVWFAAKNNSMVAQLHCWRCGHPLKKHVKVSELTVKDIMHPCPSPHACKSKNSLIGDNQL